MINVDVYPLLYMYISYIMKQIYEPEKTISLDEIIIEPLLIPHLIPKSELE